MRRTGKMYKFCWVPSHINIDGNERADSLARNSILAPNTEQATFTLPRGDLRASIRKSAKEKWAQAWRTTEYNKLREVTDNLSPLPNASCENRHWERCLARLRIGHTRLTHGYLMSRDEQPTCEECEDIPLTIKHILVECTVYQNQRRRHFGPGRATMQSLLREGDTSFGGLLYKYLNDIQLISNL